MESKPKIPEFRINPEIFHPCLQSVQQSGTKLLEKVVSRRH